MGVVLDTEPTQFNNTDMYSLSEIRRNKRLKKLVKLLAVLFMYTVSMDLLHKPFIPNLYPIYSALGPYATAIVLLLAMGAMVIIPAIALGRSPHITFMPDRIDTRLDDIYGAPELVSEVRDHLNLFLSFRHFENNLKGTVPRGLLFEGPPGTGKTYIAKAIAGSAGVPFLFVSASAFQSMYHGQTNKKIRAYFRALRKASNTYGGAIGFIEEIDAIAQARSGMGRGVASEGVSGVVNELLVQMQSFDQLTGAQQFKIKLKDFIDTLRRQGRPVKTSKVEKSRIMLIAATNRADSLDPALLRPGRFDKRVYFDLPNYKNRVDFLKNRLSTIPHDPELELESTLMDISTQTMGYSPAMLENLLQEGLRKTLLRGAAALSVEDIQKARLLTELGLAKDDSCYNLDDATRIAVHEAGHALCAYYGSTNRKLEVLSIVKRAKSLGLLAHTPRQEKVSEDKSELMEHLVISMGGYAAEKEKYGKDHVSTGPASDLVSATSIAANIVGSFGMGRSLISMAAMSGFGNEDIVSKVLNNQQTRAEVDMLLSDALEKATSILREHSVEHGALVKALLTKSELLSTEIYEVIESSKVSVAP